MPQDIYCLDSEGQPLYVPPKRFGAERAPKLSECAPLFNLPYSLCGAGACLHSHHPSIVLVSLMFDRHFEATHLEMIKGVSGHGYYDTMKIPIINNTARECNLTDSLRLAIQNNPGCTAVIVRRHGMYVWGSSWEKAKAQAECLHYLFDVAVQMKKMGADPTKPAGYVPDTNDEPGLAHGFGEGLTEKDVIADGKKDRWAWMEGGKRAASGAGAGDGSGHGGASAGSKRRRPESEAGEEGAAKKHRAEGNGSAAAAADGFHGASNGALATDADIVGLEPALQEKPSLKSYRAVLLDIEGCMTPLSFVHDTLFPYAAKHMRAWLETNWGKPECQSMVRDLEADVPAGTDVASVDSAFGALKGLADRNAKVTSLKRVQGAVWRAGYASGELKGDLFADVVPFLQRAAEAGVKCYIYSSGSREAQRLLFEHSKQGDIRGLLAGYFDTTTGPKVSSASYKSISLSVGAASPSEVLFFTDAAKEAVAATQAGMHVVLTDRPGNVGLPKSKFVTVSDFAGVA